MAPGVEKDITVIDKEGGNTLIDATNNEVYEMVLGNNDEEMDLIFGDDDITIGRMPVGLDENEFDQMLPTRYANDGVREGAYGDELDLLSGDETTDKPAPFEEPGLDQFPIFRAALTYFHSTGPKPRTLRVDTDETYDDFVGAKTEKEIAHRIDDLRGALEENASEDLEVLGADIADLQNASDADEAIDAMPAVPVDVPSFASGYVKCWRSGPEVICSLRFETPNGDNRIATMSTVPRVHQSTVMGLAEQSDLITVLGVLPDLVAKTAGNKLVKDLASATLESHDDIDICGMDGSSPLFKRTSPSKSQAPLAALMFTQQQADVGNPQAANEMAIIRHAATTPTGLKVAAPVLEEVDRRLAHGRRSKRRSRGLFGRLADSYARAAGWR